MRVCALSYCNMSCRVHLMSLGGLPLSEGRQRNGSGREGRLGEELGEVEGGKTVVRV